MRSATGAQHSTIGVRCMSSFSRVIDDYDGMESTVLLLLTNGSFDLCCEDGQGASVQLIGAWVSKGLSVQLQVGSITPAGSNTAKPLPCCPRQITLSCNKNGVGVIWGSDGLQALRQCCCYGLHHVLPKAGQQMKLDVSGRELNRIAAMVQERVTEQRIPAPREAAAARPNRRVPTVTPTQTHFSAAADRCKKPVKTTGCVGRVHPGCVGAASVDPQFQLRGQERQRDQRFSQAVCGAPAGSSGRLATLPAVQQHRQARAGNQSSNSRSGNVMALDAQMFSALTKSLKQQCRR